MAIIYRATATSSAIYCSPTHSITDGEMPKGEDAAYEDTVVLLEAQGRIQRIKCHTVTAKTMMTRQEKMTDIIKTQRVA